MAKAIRSQSLTEETQVPFRASSDISGGQSGTGEGSSPGTSVFLC